MFGLPDGAALSRVVFELCRVHPRTVDEHHGLEAPLLHMLERAIGSDQGRGSVSGVSGASGVLNLGALDLWRSIGDTVGAHWPGRGDLSQAKTHLIQRLELWTASLAGTDEEVHLLEMAHYWHSSIRNLLEPPKEVPLRGVTCPTCKQDRVLVLDPDGGTIYQPPLLAYLSETPVRVECRGCTGTWFGHDLSFIAASEDFLKV
jgi:hypothetical protein